MSEENIKQESATGGVIHMVEMMATVTEAYRKKAEECDTLKARVAELEAELKMKEVEVFKERTEKEHWMNLYHLYRDAATTSNVMLKLIILSASRLQEVMSRINEFQFIAIMRTVLRDALNNPNDIEQQKLVDSTTAFPEPQVPAPTTQQIMNFNGPVEQQVAYANEVRNKERI